jgi:hypothetical protein
MGYQSDREAGPAIPVALFDGWSRYVYVTKLRCLGESNDGHPYWNIWTVNKFFVDHTAQ